MRNGRQVWAVGFGQHAIGWAQLRCHPQLDCSFEREDAAEAQVCAQVETAAGLFWPARESVKDRAFRNAFRSEDIERVVPCLAGMHNQWQVAFLRDVNLVGECNSLLRPG